MVNKEQAIAELLAIKKVRDDASEQYNAKLLELINNFGEFSFCKEMPLIDEKGHKFFRFTVKDNIKAMENGETIWKSVSMSPFSAEVKYLKRKPKEMED